MARRRSHTCHPRRMNSTPLPRVGPPTGGVNAWAEKLGHDDAVELLAVTLEEEKATDEALTELADTVINTEAEEDKLRPISNAFPDADRQTSGRSLRG
jgi:hypothetical protein